MGNIQKSYGRTGRVVWRARYRTPDGKGRSKSFSRKLDAERFLAGTETSKVVGAYSDPVRSRMTVGEWVRIWLDVQQHLKPSSRERYASILRQHVNPRWSATRLADVSHADVQSWVADLTRRLSPSAARKAHRVLSLVLSLAVRDGRLPRNPADHIALPREQYSERRYLSHEEVRDLAAACAAPREATAKRRSERGDGRADYELVVLVLAYTGVRFGELAALRVRNVDLVARRLMVSDAVTSVNGRLVWGSPKGHQRRQVPLPTFVADRLRRHVAGLSHDDLLFTSPVGETLRASNFRRDVFGPAVGEVGLTGLVPHGLRHTAASLAIAAGADVKVVQHMLGHKSATMTLDLYGHLFDTRLNEVADALDRAVAKLPGANRGQTDHLVDLQDHRENVGGQQIPDL